MEDYWYHFGYAIGGPACLSYASWIHDELKKQKEITDIFFVSRDGWVIKKIFDRINRTEAVSHYIYSSRSISLIYNNNQRIGEYRAYMQSVSGSIRGNAALADGVTMNFSSQRLMENALQRKLHGFYWCVLNGDNNYQDTLRWSSFQKEHYHVIRNWNFIEYIMSSPEPPAVGIRDGKPVFKKTDEREQKREEEFQNIENGILDFVTAYLEGREDCDLSVDSIVKSVNSFLRNPAQEDIERFKDIYFSENSQHSDLVLLDPFLLYERKKKLYKIIKDRLWFVSLKHKSLYVVLHKSKKLLEKILLPFRHTAVYDGSNPDGLLEKLKEYDLVSFDVFDTLLLRKCKNPEDVFAAAGEKLQIAGFASLRQNAEKTARLKSVNGEVSIEDVYRELKTEDRYTAEELIACELETEEQMCFANKDFADLTEKLHNLHIKTIAVSDMYLHADQVESLLKHCGYVHMDKIFVSSDCYCHKSDGTLQEYVRSCYGGTKKIIHIGDNYTSDVRYMVPEYWDTVYYKRRGIK